MRRRKKIKVEKKGFNPKSLENLNRSGRQVYYNEEKVCRNLTVSSTAWDKLPAIAEDAECPSISEFVEQVGRGFIQLQVSSGQSQPQARDNKTRHNIALTPSAWEQVQAIKKSLGARSVSDLLERIGFGEFQPRVITDEIDLRSVSASG